jgi:hypothetical protein
MRKVILKKGDTLSGLFGNDWQAIAAYNKITNPTQLQIGRVIVDPRQEEVGATPGATPGATDTGVEESGEEGFLSKASKYANDFFGGDVRDVYENLSSGMSSLGNDVYSSYNNSPMPTSLKELGSPEELAAMGDIGTLKDYEDVTIGKWGDINNIKEEAQAGVGEINRYADKSIARNIRNNNLGNLKITGDRWQGMVDNPNEETFVTFDSPEKGIRAMNRVVDANLRATNSFETYVNRYASEPREKARYAESGKLDEHLFNYAKQLAESQGIKTNTYVEYVSGSGRGSSAWIEGKPVIKSKKDWIKATAVAEGGEGALDYFSDDIIDAGLLLR